jgi:NTP pyrophosphatase (non-canonical NTP hydrolase)
LKKDAPDVLIADLPDVESIEEVTEFFVKTNRPEYNILKCCEELTELQEVLLKYHLKIPEKKPPIEKVIEEAGDVIFRLAVVVEQFNIFDEVGDRIREKVEKLIEYYKQGKYKGGI